MSKKAILKESRFLKLIHDPKFKRIPRYERKVKIDKRFESMFTDNAFKVNYSVDKRGRQLSNCTTENLKKFYDLSDEENEVSSNEAQISEAGNPSEEGKSTGEQASSDDAQLLEADINSAQEVRGKSMKNKTQMAIPSLIEKEKDTIRKEQISPYVRNKLRDINVDYARGEGKLFSESSSDESESEESEVEIYHEWNELDKDAETTDNITRRIAICNMDWDRVKALDLFMLFSSFLSPKGVLYSIIVYPSEFGLKRLAEEETKGPAELVHNNDNTVDESDSDFEAEEGKQFHVERMRQYQFKRLKYYYAVATFDSAETADLIYNQCNGVEYETSGIRLDLRFIADDIDFDQEPKDICNSIEDRQKYHPIMFKNTALQQAKVELTWDETDPRRVEYTQRITDAAKVQDINDSDLENLVALTSSGEDEEEELATHNSASDNISGESEDDSISAFRNLLKEIENKKGGEIEKSEPELEITWGGDTNSSERTTKISKRAPEKEKDKLTPFERLVEKKKEKLKIKKNMKLEKQKREDPDTHRDNRQKSKSKKKYKRVINIAQKDEFEVNVNDERFSALYTSHLFHIDPTNPKFHTTKGMSAFILEKQKRLQQKENDILIQEPVQKKKNDAELSFTSHQIF